MTDRLRIPHDPTTREELIALLQQLRAQNQLGPHVCLPLATIDRIIERLEEQEEARMDEPNDADLGNTRGTDE